MKQCTGPCQKVKLLEEFIKSSRTKSGYAAQCIECNRARYKTYHAANPEVAAVRGKKWANANPDKNSDVSKSNKL